MLYTRRGDGGTSGLWGSARRLGKDAPVYDALGSLDELNSLLGVCYARARSLGSTAIAEAVRTGQQRLFVIQAELAGAPVAITHAHLDDVEQTIDALEKQFGNPHAFVIPGATELSALLDYARAVARRAERTALSSRQPHPPSLQSRAYLNRLSSLLYALARSAAFTGGAEEPSPSY